MMIENSNNFTTDTEGGIMSWKKFLCLVVRHKKELREWPYSGPYVKLMIPYCSRCGICLTVLPIEMLEIATFNKHVGFTNGQ